MIEDRIVDTSAEMSHATAHASERLCGLRLVPFSRNGCWSLAVSVGSDRASSFLLVADLNAAAMIAALDRLRPGPVAAALRKEARFHASRAKEWASGADAFHAAAAPRELARAAAYAEWAARLELRA